ncbi:MAG TPA: PepSY domain-containing protein [Bryobacteraceae bacterium]
MSHRPRQLSRDRQGAVRDSRRGKTFLRELSFRLHSWLGIGAAVYLLLMSLTGATLIFYPQLYAALSPHPSVSSKRPPLTTDELRRVLLKSWPGYEVSWIWPRNDSGAWTVRLTDSRQRINSRVVNAFTGEDLGPAYPASVEALNVLKELHENLLLGRPGQTAHVVGGLIMLLLAATGAAVWWPGRHRWRRHTLVRRRSRGKRLVWEIHSAVAFWTVLFDLMWGATGLVLVWRSVTTLSANQRWFEFAYRFHAGNFQTPILLLVWALAALTLPVLAITGLQMWLNRSTNARQPRHYGAHTLLG